MKCCQRGSRRRYWQKLLSLSSGVNLWTESKKPPDETVSHFLHRRDSSCFCLHSVCGVGSRCEDLSDFRAGEQTLSVHLDSQSRRPGPHPPPPATPPPHMLCMSRHITCTWPLTPSRLLFSCTQPSLCGKTTYVLGLTTSRHGLHFPFSGSTWRSCSLLVSEKRAFIQDLSTQNTHLPLFPPSSSHSPATLSPLIFFSA